MKYLSLSFHMMMILNFNFIQLKRSNNNVHTQKKKPLFCVNSSIKCIIWIVPSGRCAEFDISQYLSATEQILACNETNWWFVKLFLFLLDNINIKTRDEAPFCCRCFIFLLLHYIFIQLGQQYFHRGKSLAFVCYSLCLSPSFSL